MGYVWRHVEGYFFGASLVDALFYFAEVIMKLKKFVLCLVVLFLLSSCVSVNNVPKTTDKLQDTATPATESADVTEEIPTKTEKTEGKIENPFIINKNTKKYHNEDCRYVGFMNDENKVFVTSTPEKLQSQSYKPCHFCQ